MQENVFAENVAELLFINRFKWYISFNHKLEPSSKDFALLSAAKNYLNDINSGYALMRSQDISVRSLLSIYSSKSLSKSVKRYDTFLHSKNINKTPELLTSLPKTINKMAKTIEDTLAKKEVIASDLIDIKNFFDQIMDVKLSQNTQFIYQWV